MTEYCYLGSELDLFAQANRWKAYIAASLAPFVGGRVLEVGAGLGATALALADIPVTAWTCIEPDSDLAQRLQENLNADMRLQQHRIVKGLLSDLSSEEYFETILYIDVLEHIADDREELAEAAKHLAPGGRLIVLSPAYTFLYSPFDAAIGHFRRYRRRTLAGITPSDLNLLRCRYLDSVGLLASLANRLFLRASQPTPAQIATWDGIMVPLSRWLDPLVGYTFGRSVLAVWTAPASGR